MANRLEVVFVVGVDGLGYSGLNLSWVRFFRVEDLRGLGEFCLVV